MKSYCTRLLVQSSLYNFKYNLYLSVWYTVKIWSVELEMLQIRVIRFSIIKFPRIYSDLHGEEECGVWVDWLPFLASISSDISQRRYRWIRQLRTYTYLLLIRSRITFNHQRIHRRVYIIGTFVASRPVNQRQLTSIYGIICLLSFRKITADNQTFKAHSTQKTKGFWVSMVYTIM